MKLVNVNEDDLSEVYFTEFPDYMARQECRDVLELLICEIHDEDYEGLEEDEIPEPVITPFYLMRAVMRKARKDFELMSEEERAWVIKRFWDSRKGLTNL